MVIAKFPYWLLIKVISSSLENRGKILNIFWGWDGNSQIYVLNTMKDMNLHYLFEKSDFWFPLSCVVIF